jgi:hypothetical protein
MNTMKGKLAALIALLALASIPSVRAQTNPYDGYIVDYYRGRLSQPIGQIATYAQVSATGCPIFDKPVCGSDLKTYQNECFLLANGVKKAYEGWCITTFVKPNSGPAAVVGPFDETPDRGFTGEPSFGGVCPCNTAFYPVCASNGLTYSNLCFAKCLGATAIAVGPCFSFNYVPVPNLQCTIDTTDTQTVCGKDGVSYYNAGVMKCFGVAFNGLEKCAANCNCGFIYKPVCGVDGRSYWNACELSCKNVQKAFDGKCEDNLNSQCISCVGTVSKVCGVDGLTYDNECYLKCNRVNKAYEGTCLPPKPNGVCVCAKIYLPVCGNDNVTYDNECEAGCAKREVQYAGKCKAAQDNNNHNQQNMSGCLNKCASSGNSPVCGSDGKTYGNACATSCVSILSVNVVSTQPCKPIYHHHCPCNSELKPVCGVDGKTYLNICTLNCTGMNKAWDGPCGVIGNYGFIMSQYYTGLTAPSNKPVVIPPTPAPVPAHKDRSYRHHHRRERREHGSSEKGFLLRLPPINTVPEYSDKLKKVVAKNNDQITCPTLEKIISSLYPGAKVEDPKNFKGYACRDEEKKKNVAENPVQVFIKVQQKDVSAKKEVAKETKVVLVNNNNYNINDSFEMIPKDMKKKIKENAYLYYTYFYSLIYYNQATAETLVENQCKIKDILLYICLKIFKIQPNVNSQSIELPSEAPQNYVVDNEDVATYSQQHNSSSGSLTVPIKISVGSELH